VIDPEDVVGHRRQRAKPPVHEVVPDHAEGASAQMIETQRQLERLRADDDLSRPWQWLCRWRSDRHHLEAIARDEGLEVAAIKAGIDRALRLEGTTFAAVDEAMCRPRVRLGRGLPQQVTT